MGASMTNYHIKFALIAQILGASGCVSYTPSAFPVTRDILAGPDVAIISADASHIQRPYLTAQSIDLSAPLTPNALAVIAVLENPDLKAQRGVVRVLSG